MTWCNPATFVLQRRVNEDIEHVWRILGNRAIFDRGCVVAWHEGGSLRLDGPFRVTDHPSHRTQRADATMLGTRGRRVAPVEIEIGPWSVARDAEVSLRPRSFRPDRWSNRKIRRYFTHAHRGADDLTGLLQRVSIMTRAAQQPSGTAPPSSHLAACTRRR